jgi:hypothetical protein
MKHDIFKIDGLILTLHCFKSIKLLKLRHIGICFGLLALAGCQKTYVVSKYQSVLYQLEYSKDPDKNLIKGYYIDSKGNILRYNSPVRWNYPREDETISKSELLENLSLTKKDSNKIELTELQKYVNYIDNIAASKVTLTKLHTTDSATLYFYCYQYSDDSEEYKRTLIKTEGRINCENLNFFTKKVVTWMSGIEKTDLK